MSDDRTWTVVRFSSDSVLATVPTKWLKEGNKCYYPPLPEEKLETAVKNQAFDSCWPSYDIEVIRISTFNSYHATKEKQNEIAIGASTSASTKQSDEVNKHLFLPGPSTATNSSLDNVAVTQGTGKKESSPGKNKQIKKPRSTWTVRSKLLLLDLYRICQEGLAKKKISSKKFWEVIAANMSTRNGVTFSSTACANKFRDMKKIYKINKDYIGSSGQKSTWPYFNEMDSLLYRNKKQ